MRASLLCDWQSVSWLNLGCKRCEGSGEVLTLEMSEDVALLPLHSLAGPGHCALPLEGWNTEISSRRGCPFCPPPPPPICILPLGVPLSREPLHDPAGKLQRCLSPCCFSLSLQKQHAFYLFICCIGFKHCQVTLRQISAGHRGDHTFANFMLPTLHGKGCVRDGVADGERCERCDCSRVAAVVGVAVCSPIAALFS